MYLFVKFKYEQEQLKPGTCMHLRLYQESSQFCSSGLGYCDVQSGILWVTTLHPAAYTHTRVHSSFFANVLPLFCAVGPD